MISSPFEPASAMERLGLFTAGAASPAHRTEVRGAHLQMGQSHLGGAEHIQITITPGGLGFYREPRRARAMPDAPVSAGRPA